MANTFYTVQNLVCPEVGTQLIVGQDYEVTFTNPYTMFSADWYEESKSVIGMYWRDGDGNVQRPRLKEQVVVTGENTFRFNLADYALDSSNISGIGIQIDARISINESLSTLYFTGDPNETLAYGAPIFYTACGTPTDCSLSSTLSTENVTLSWSGATAGNVNAITGYEIQRCESTDGSTWGSWETAPESPVTTTEGSGSASVAPPATAGNYYKYRVRTQGAAGSDYYSDWLESENVLRRDHAALAGFTDSTLTAGTSPVKALHMQELQDRTNTLRAFYGLTAYAFTTITAGQTSLAGWTAHINEIRAAIEEVCNASGKTHENWISFSVNCPRADVIQQLRSVILAL